MVIQPEVFVTPDRPVVRFREPREKIDLAVELPKVLHSQGWGAGTYFHVQFIDHDRTALLASAEFMVTAVTEGIHTSEANPYQPITKTIFMRQFEQIGEWWVSAEQRVIAEQNAIDKKFLPSRPEELHNEEAKEPHRRGRPPKSAVA